ncbi:MAG: hypothetical protein DBY32_09490 [Phascolarctobacterium sp.]|nr:MAG: hypothetical protein DBY32_09490 [Phascolarctobacterium sp.]
MNEEKTKSFIANFLCKKDDDIEYFLHSKAIEDENSLLVLNRILQYEEITSVPEVKVNKNDNI